MAIRIYISIITLNGDGLNAPTKKTWTGGMDTKTTPIYSCLQETNFRLKDIHRLKVRGWKKTFIPHKWKSK